MTAQDITSVAGWIGFVLIGLEVLFPYLLRRKRMSVWLESLLARRTSKQCGRIIGLDISCCCSA